MTHNAKPEPPLWDRDAVLGAVRSAYDDLRQDYTTRGGVHYPGYLDADEGHGFVGSWIWSEFDLQHRFASLLERRLPNAVHLGMPLRPGTRDDLEPTSPGDKVRVSYIDIVISDPAALPIDDPGDVFRRRTHEAFIEVKWFPQVQPAVEVGLPSSAPR